MHLTAVCEHKCENLEIVALFYSQKLILTLHINALSRHLNNDSSWCIDASLIPYFPQSNSRLGILLRGNVCWNTMDLSNLLDQDVHQCWRYTSPEMSYYAWIRPPLWRTEHSWCSVHHLQEKACGCIFPSFLEAIESTSQTPIYERSVCITNGFRVSQKKTISSSPGRQLAPLKSRGYPWVTCEWKPLWAPPPKLIIKMAVKIGKLCDWLGLF